MWRASEHTDDENVRWSHLRAIEWLEWPLFMSAPVVPVLLYFFSWPWVVGAVVVISFLWRVFVVPFWLAPRLAYAGPQFVLLRFLTCPVMAYLLWQRGQAIIAIVALTWPVISPCASMVLALPVALLLRTRLGKATQIGPVQTRFLLAIGQRRGLQEPDPHR
jgi:hypothetical protein